MSSDISITWRRAAINEEGEESWQGAGFTSSLLYSGMKVHFCTVPVSSSVVRPSVRGGFSRAWGISVQRESGLLTITGIIGLLSVRF